MSAYSAADTRSVVPRMQLLHSTRADVEFGSQGFHDDIDIYCTVLVVIVQRDTLHKI